MDNIYIILVIFLLLGLLLVAKGVLSPKSRFSEKDRTEIMYKLSELSSGIESATASDRRDKIVRADNLVSKVLQQYYSNKESFGANLKVSNRIFEKTLYNDIWQAHKIRNEIVHNDIEVTSDEVKFALSTFRRAIKQII